MAGFSLTAVFGIDATGVKTEIKQLRRELNSFVQDYAKLGAGVAVGAFVALSKGAMDLAAQLKDTALQTGINVESLQAMHFAALQNGSSVESMNKALEKLRLNTQAAAEGNKEQAAAFAQLGINVQAFLALPLEKRYEAIGRAVKASSDKQAAYNAVSDIFGTKIGPDQIQVLNSLATDGFPKTAKAAAAAGQVMSAETVVALEKASQAIEDFKKRATVAVGNIIVNFRSEEGLKLLLFQFLRVVGVFGAKIVDAVIEANSIIGAVFTGTFRAVANKFRDFLLDSLTFWAQQVNKLLPKKFEIDVSSIQNLKSSGEGVADSISRAIAETKPSTFTKDVTKFWDKTVTDQQAVVDQLNKVDFGPQATQLKQAGTALQAGGTQAADAFNPVMQAWSKNIKDSLEVAKQMGSLLMGIRGGSTFNDLSDEALKEVVRQNRAQAAALRNPALNKFAGGIGASLDAGRLEAEALNAQSNLDVRNRFRTAVANRGIEGARRDFDPVVFETLLRQFGPGTTGDKTVQLLEQIKRDGIPVRPVNTPSPFR